MTIVPSLRRSLKRGPGEPLHQGLGSLRFILVPEAPNQPKNRPLEGVRVADLTTVVMGPLATRMLADLGADVIRVEAPEGDVIRHYEPMRSEAMSAFAMSLNRNKRSLMLNLKSDEGRDAMRDLLTTSDVFVTNIRRPALARLGLDEESVRAVRPDIIYCVANGFGSGGPKADQPAYDDIMQAASGLASVFAWSGEEPRLIPSIVADKVTGLHIAIAIAAALHGRARTGEGASIEVPMAETMTAFNLVEHLGGKTFEPPLGEFSYSRVRTPHRRPRRTLDGWIVILPYSGDNWRRFWEFAQRPELMDDPRLSSPTERVKHADALYGLMDDVVAEKTTAEWMEYCTEHSIPASEVVDLDGVWHDPHFEAVDLMREDLHPTEGAYRYVRDPIVFDGEPSPLRYHPPRLGADSAEVLEELGWSADRIERFVADSD